MIPLKGLSKCQTQTGQSYKEVTVLGLRLIDDFGNYIFNKTFHKSKEGAWATKYIPNG